ncbi:MAG: hypothetical protein EA358_10135 [Flavobacteriales bacterium]|nr:MAG: hypothetical protein EA358_10135 [Flavobacteriales bacterium]
MLSIHKKSIFIICLLLLGLPFTSYSQRLLYFNGDYTIMDTVKGRAIYAYYAISDDSIQFQGSFRFNSDLLLKEEAMRVSNVEIQGNFSRGIKRGKWEYEQSVYDVTLLGIKNLRVESELNGEQFRVLGNYRNGRPHGTWQTQRSRIEASKAVGKSVTSSLSFQDGVATGNYEYERDIDGRKVTVKGSFDDNGFMNGEWNLQYFNEGLEFIENRNYTKGFLTDILVISVDSVNTRDTLYDLVFYDVKDRLTALYAGIDDLNFEIGEKGFGLDFDNGYRDEDPEQQCQQKGNQFLRDVFEIFDAKKSIIGVISEIHPPIINFTRRFKYIYPDEDIERAEDLLSRVSHSLKEVDSIISLPAIKLNRQRNDSTAMAYAFLEHAENVLVRIERAARRINTDFFDYNNRDIFFKDGVPGLTKTFNLKYDFNNRSRNFNVEYSRYIIGPDSLVENLDRFYQELQNKMSIWIAWVDEKISIIQKEKEIQEIDQQIVDLFNKLNLIYVGQKTDSLFVLPTDKGALIRGAAMQKSQLQREVFDRFENQLREDMVRDYATTESFEQRVTKGNRIIDLSQAMVDVFYDLEKIDRMPESLDSAFIIFRENPFFDRMLESRIRSNIYSKGVERLLPDMRRELLRFKTGAELREKVEEIKRLNERLIELANAPNEDEDVKRLDRRMRRENLPDRIKRLLGL